MRTTWIAFSCVAIMAASPALSQQKVTDTCAGQPTFTGSDSGDQTGLAFPTGITEDTFEMDGGGLRRYLWPGLGLLLHSREPV